MKLRELVRPLGRTLALGACAVASLLPTETEAQLSEPCEIACGIGLGAVGVVVGTGTAVAAGRLVGGFSTVGEGALYWGSGFALAVGTGLALGGDGPRQQRAVHGALLGAGGGALLGLAVSSLWDESDAATPWVGTLLGAAAGALTGGVYGAVSHVDDRPVVVPLAFSVTLAKN